MEVLNLDLMGAVPSVFTRPVNPEYPASLEWVGLNKNCSVIPERALELKDESNYHGDHTTTDQWGRFETIEWADQPDWYDPETHYRGWIPLARENDVRRGAWARATRTNLSFTRLADGTYKLDEDASTLVTNDLIYFRELLEEVCAGPLYDQLSHAPPLFDIDRIELTYASELELHRMAMDAKRSVLEICGHLTWWTAAVSDWMNGLDHGVVERVWNLELRSYKARGLLITVNQDWKEINFPLLVKHGVPIFYVWGLFEERDPRFKRLDPRILANYLQEVRTRDVRGLWGDEVAVVRCELEVAARYDRFLQLKLDPFSRPRNPVPTGSPISGDVLYYVIDFQHWARRLLSEDEDASVMGKLYHHIVVEGVSEKVTRVIFQRFHCKPRDEVLNSDSSIMEEDLPEPDLAAIRERFKGRCAPRKGQTFDPETGVERTRPLGEEKTIDEISRFEADRLLVNMPPCLGGPMVMMPRDDPEAHDATALGRTLGDRLTSPYSDRSSERREYDSPGPRAHVVGWVAAMARTEGRDSVRNYSADRRVPGPRYEVRRLVRSPSPGYDDIRSHISISTRSSRAGTPRRSASPEPRGRRHYPLKLSSPPPFRAQASGMMTVPEMQQRRARWLNDFADWGRAATFRASLWRVPFEFQWNQDVLEYGYLIISKPAEFRLRYQALTDANIRFPRHVLELALERGIGFAIGFKRSDTDRFRPKLLRTGRQVSKSVVDRHGKGLRLNPAPSISTIYEQYCGNIGKIGGGPLAPSVVARGGGASWILRAYIGIELVREYMKGPSVQVSVHQSGANDSGDADCIDVSWDELGSAEYESIFGYMPGTTQAEDTYFFPTDEIMEEYSDHYFREWNPFCDLTFKRIKAELDDKRGKRRTRKEWRDYFQSSNRGKYAPAMIVNREFVDEGMDRITR
ncbi:hypothetical protein B0H15DRAFT_957753 [Mycena belliarum]|uniref:Uncharacterized protein n=1 Tax=Mycena belliarum TaxID=1033014 RepID=A0AAD6TP56_9AGAR|nr:hypothetical protein B0H15DRAFT_957753 [Mycena belliae]